jgi:hypothetical protein
MGITTRNLFFRIECHIMLCFGSLLQLRDELLIFTLNVLQIGCNLPEVERVVLSSQSIALEFQLPNFRHGFSFGLNALQKISKHTLVQFFWSITLKKCDPKIACKIARTNIEANNNFTQMEKVRDR